jgi:predicted enzyme related to lactoylglutathione lyase
MSESGVEPHLAKHGKVSFVEIPAADTVAIAAFYADVFGWNIRGDNPAHISFDDTPHDLIGAFVNTRAAPSEAGVVPYMYVEGIDATLEKVRERGGQVVREPYAEGGLWVATFRDPAGNLMGVWQGGPR